MTITNAFDATATSIRPIDSARLRRAKISHVTRRLNVIEHGRYLLSGDVEPRAGDVVLARVDEIRHHTRLELSTGRKCIMFPGDEIVLCYGDRYAPDQFCAEVPKDLSACSLVAAGGMAAAVVSMHKRIAGATGITPLGLIASSPAHRMNVMDGALRSAGWSSPKPPTFAVFGTAMNSGKTISAAHLVKGLHRAGLRVGADRKSVV